MIAYPWASPSASAMRISSSASGRGRNDPGVRWLSIVDVSIDDIVGREGGRVKALGVHRDRQTAQRPPEEARITKRQRSSTDANRGSARRGSHLASRGR